MGTSPRRGSRARLPPSPACEVEGEGRLRGDCGEVGEVEGEIMGDRREGRVCHPRTLARATSRESERDCRDGKIARLREIAQNHGTWRRAPASRRIETPSLSGGEWWRVVESGGGDCSENALLCPSRLIETPSLCE